jgi:2-polyprenyl-3-methyl-5-hydroxy-6-metoxy-1,4-benzoquinol methylase
MADQGTEGLLSAFLRRQRIRIAKPYIIGRILDVGCGSGALAGLVDFTSYVGVEVDRTSLNKAKDKYPLHCFINSLPAVSEKFDTVISLAVIEHVPDPTTFLISLSKYLANHSMARIVITTPHPSVEWVHEIGASIGLFSKHANEEHKALFNKQQLLEAGLATGLRMLCYKRFLFGANQLAIFSK